MCACEPKCEPFTEDEWPTEECPNPECTDKEPVKPVGARNVGGKTIGLTFHCVTCPTRWYSAYELAN
jgi:hypothetical protein